VYVNSPLFQENIPRWGVCCWDVNTKTHIRRRVNIFVIFGAQCVILGHIVFFWGTLCYFGAHFVILGHTVLFWGTLCYFGAHCVILGHIVLFWGTLCYFGTHCVILGHIVLCWDTLCYFGVHCVILGHIVLLCGTLCYFGAQCVILGHRVLFWGTGCYFGAQCVNKTEPFAPNTIPLSVLLYYFLCHLRPGTLSINSAVKQNTSPPPIHRTQSHIRSRKAGTTLKVHFSYSLNTNCESP